MSQIDTKLEKFTADGATLLMLASAIAPSFDRAEFNVPLRGSLAERAEQAAQLFAQGIMVARLEEGGAMRSSDMLAAMNIIAKHRPAGWQQFKEELLNSGACHESEFEAEGLNK
jgi:hypothetical protein